MKIEWEGHVCIVCKNSTELSIEHIIPRSLGGRLTCSFICRQCNSEFGSGFESQARLAPMLRKAAAKHRSLIPELYDALEYGAKYESEFDGVAVAGRLLSSGAISSSQRDGTIYASEKESEKILIGKLRKGGHSDKEIFAAVEGWKTAKAGEPVEVSAGLMVKKHVQHPSQPTYQENELNPLNVLKIAYHFLALLIGRSILDDVPTFNVVREALRNQDASLADSFICSGMIESDAPFHGVAFTKNDPFCTIRICLFGTILFEVTLDGCAINVDKTTYYHDLVSNEERVFAD